MIQTVIRLISCTQVRVKALRVISSAEEQAKGLLSSQKAVHLTCMCTESCNTNSQLSHKRENKTLNDPD